MRIAKSKLDPFLKSVAIGYIGCLSEYFSACFGVYVPFSTIRSAEPFSCFTGMMLSMHLLMNENQQLEEEEAKDRENLRFSRMVIKLE